jgi:SAM-dependent methyltransferase
MASSVQKSEAANVEHLQRMWDCEYGEVQLIPSSTRPLPSKALVQYEGLLDFSGLSPVLDAGCGNGRNSIYLASKGCTVDAVDLSPVALALVRQRALAAEVSHKIRIHQQVLKAPWPFSDATFRLVLDSYVFCHILEQKKQIEYRNELHRVLQPSGLLYSSVFCTDDAYYQELADNGSLARPVVQDPHNGVRKYLYTEEGFKEFFSECFRIIYFSKFQFDDVVAGRTFRRSILSLILEK